tara:strand:+ start:2665 stop:4359 length:1695 start_codon:yes stop_codon:yes gene_type:complete
MASTLNNLLTDAGNSYQRQLDTTRNLVHKWDRTGLLEGIDQEYDKHGMAVLLENQARQLIDENSKTGTANNSEEWSGVALPLVRRIFAEIAAKDFVSVQPMNLPSGLVFFLDFKYGTSQPGFTVDTGQNQTGTVHGITGAAAKDTDASDGLYGAGRFGYSINEATSANLSCSSATTAAVYTTASLAGVPNAAYNYDTAFSSSNGTELALYPADGAIFKLTIATSALTNPDYEGVRSFEPSGSGITAWYPQFTKYNASSNTIDFVVKGQANGHATTENVAINYSKQPTDVTRGDFEDTTGGNPDAGATGDIGIPEIDVQLRSEAIVAKTRKLKAVWSPEFAQDLNAYHSIDAEAELTSMLSEYISMEIDLEILDMLIANAQSTEYWSVTIDEVFNPGTSTWGNGGATAAAYNQQTWFQTIGTKIVKLSNVIHQKTMRGGANFLVCSPKVATVLESIPGFATQTDGEAWGTKSFAMGVQKLGMLNSRFQVYKNPYMLENQVLVGYRGSQFLETGAVYAPYVPLIMTPLIYDPTNFTPRKGVMTRYAKKIVRPEFYGKLIIKDLNLL